ncbi:acyltransferase [Janthinobacterium sp. FW305-129]|uniref:acyltransferase n=1 Tax=Janthinobacterium sp. FW305-129 TaxID=2775054 RepID=UPI001E5F9F40|nr:acyltransferase [Janthinobacterium sp. FW305-129]MCC7598329.1 acyltransferase [Janthinobacterium sp. FW305-129]
MKKIKRIFELSPFWRWWSCFFWARQRVRLHPSVRIEGSAARLRIGHSTKIGAASVLEIGPASRVAIGSHCWFYRDIEIRSNGVLSIGSRTTLQKGVTLNGNVRIGANCILAPNIFISSGTHIFDRWPGLPIQWQEQFFHEGVAAPAGARLASDYDRPVEIGEDCWLGVNAMILPGVTIGRGCVVGAGSVVSKSVAPYSIVAGVPAKPIGQRLIWLPPVKLDASQRDAIPYLYEGFDCQLQAQMLVARMGERTRIALSSEVAASLRMKLHAAAGGRLRLGEHEQDLVAGDNLLSFPVTQATGQSYAGAVLYEFILSGSALNNSVTLLSCELSN